MNDHDHSDEQEEAGHSHLPKNERKLGIAALLTGGFMLAEVFGGLLSGSLALIADAGHMLTDSASLVLAWFAIYLIRRPADWKLTYGFDRFSVLAALVNGISLFVIAIWITIEAVQRISEPQEVLGGLMLWVAIGGLLVNIIVFLILTKGESENLNIRAATLHVAGDLLGSIAALIASLVIIFTGWTPIDPILSVLVVLLILKSAWGIVKESGHILLEGAPRGFDLRKATSVILKEVDGVKTVKHFHAWSVTQERPMVTLEIELENDSDAQSTTNNVKKFLKERYNISHSTIEVI